MVNTTSYYTLFYKQDFSIQIYRATYNLRTKHFFLNNLIIRDDIK